MNDLDNIRSKLCKLIEEKFVDVWLNTPNASFNNKKPIDLINEGNLKPLEETIYRLESGGSF
jgi:uncharacterized protein (DUF2384 family)